VITNPTLDVTRAPRPNLSVDLDPMRAARRAELARTGAGKWTVPPKTTRSPSKPREARPLGGWVTTERKRAA
jgi:hypothetical protein